MGLELCRVVLVETHYPGNLGATARAMRNSGLTDLVLVAPHADPADRNARQLSTHGELILQNARVVASLDEAVADCVLVVGTSGQTGGPFRRQSVGPPEAIIPHALDMLQQNRPAALLFGPEPTGLGNAILTRCHYVIDVPTDPGYPSLNLAQAVAVCLYELRKSWLKRQPAEPPTEPAHVPASFAEQEQMFQRLRVALEELHFLYGDKAEPLMHAVRHLLGKARLSVMEVRLLHGLARQIRWYVANRPKQSE